MFDINIENVPKKVWVMFGISAMLISVGVTFSLIFRGSAILRAEQPTDRTLADEIKGTPAVEQPAATATATTYPYPMGPYAPPMRVVYSRDNRDGRVEMVEQWGFGSGTKEIKYTTDGVVISKGD